MVFDPYDLDLDVTPFNVRQQLRLREWASAIVLAFRLNEDALKQEVLELVPLNQGKSRPFVLWWWHSQQSFKFTSPNAVFHSGSGVQLAVRCLRGEGAELCGLQLRTHSPPAVLSELGPAAVAAAHTQTQEQVSATDAGIRFF